MQYVTEIDLLQGGRNHQPLSNVMLLNHDPHFLIHQERYNLPT
ncbi:hypothetical protein [Coleofasciculus sp. E1-EBD-02]